MSHFLDICDLCTLDVNYGHSKIDLIVVIVIIYHFYYKSVRKDIITLTCKNIIYHVVETHLE